MPGSRRNSTHRTLHNSDLTKTRPFGWTAWCHFSFHTIYSVPDNPQQVLVSHQTLWKPAQCHCHFNTPKLLWFLNQRTPPPSKTMRMGPKRNANQSEASIQCFHSNVPVAMQSLNAKIQSTYLLSIGASKDTSRARATGDICC